MESRQGTMPDMFGLWKDFVSKSQESLEEAMRQTMATEEFARTLEKYTEFTLYQRQIVNRMMDQYLQNTPLPTKNDLTRLANQMVNLDAKVDRLADYLEESLEPVVRGVSEQMAQLQNQIAQMMKQVESLAQMAASASSGAATRRGKKASE